MFSAQAGDRGGLCGRGGLGPPVGELGGGDFRASFRGGGFRGGDFRRSVRGLRRDADAAAALELVEFALRLVVFAAEADGGSAQAQDAGQRQVRVGSLTEGRQRLEAETDDLGGEAEFVVVSAS
jgi:hypothetical protein